LYRLDAGLQQALGAGGTIIAPNRQRAVVLRQAWAWQQRAQGRDVWYSPDILTWDAWLARELTRQRHESGAGPVLLNPSQQHALWQQVLNELAGPDEAGLQGFAAQVASAAALAREWLPGWRGPAPTEESVLLQRALVRMDELCARRGVLQPTLATPAQLAALPPTPLLFVGVEALTPRQRAVAEAFAQAGAAVAVLPRATSDAAAAQRLVTMGDAAGEAAAVAEWCRERLQVDASARLLVVGGDQRLDPAVLRDAIAGALGDGGAGLVAAEGGDALANQPRIAAALGWLGLVGDDLDFAALGSLLLSPFHRLGAPGECVRLELWLRERLPQRFDPGVLTGLLGAVPERLETVGARLKGALGALSAALEGRHGPRDWVERIAAALDALGFPGDRKADSPELQAWRRWEAGLEEFASLQGYVSAGAAADALARLEALATRSQHQAATGDAPVTVTAWRDDPVVGYDGIWVTGLAEAQWPEAPRPDPFLPLVLQRDAGLPAASARTRLAAARAQLASWQARAQGELVLSHPRVEAGIDLSPAVLLRDGPWEHLASAARPRLAPGQAVAGAVELALPPLPRAGQLLAGGGTQLPTLQRDCPFRAQAELRLGARAVPAPRVGIDPKLRGILLHQSLERLWREIGSSERLRSRPPEGWYDAIDAAVQAAFAVPLSGQPVPPTARELARERDRCRWLLRDALELEARRDSAFSVAGSEVQKVWDVAGVQLKLRIDRVDRLDDGSHVVVDYKSGASARVDLLSEAPRPVQLLAYLDAWGGDVAGLALLKLAPGKTNFSAVEDGRAGLPRTGGAVLGADAWAAQLALWRTDVRGLVGRHLDGDARVEPLRDACAHCPLPALCRIDSRRLGDALEAPAGPRDGQGQTEGEGDDE
jgi:probable DNA repair protein